MSPPTDEQCEQARQVLLERAKAEVCRCSVSHHDDFESYSCGLVVVSNRMSLNMPMAA
jgi:hypothetical protein